MTVNKIILGCLLLTGLQACKTATFLSKITEVNPLEITVPVDNMDLYVELVDVIPLSAPDSIVVTGINKFLLDKKGDFIILDGTRIYRFNCEGEFQGQYGRVGRGPGEYLKIYDICLNRDQRELWCLDHLNAVMKYDLASGEYIGTVSTHSREMTIPNASALIPAEGNGFYLYVPNPNDEVDLEHPFYCLRRFDKNGKLVGEELLRKDFNIGLNMIPFVTQNYDHTYLLRPQENENICYDISDRGVAEKFKIHFGSENVPPLYLFQNDQNPWMNLEKFMVSDYYKNPFCIQETKKQLFLSAFGPKNSISYFLVDKEFKRGIRWNSSKAHETTPFFIMGSDEECFYGLFDKYDNPAAESLSDPMLAYLIGVKHLHLGEEDNPIVVKIKFR